MIRNKLCGYICLLAEVLKSARFLLWLIPYSGLVNLPFLFPNCKCTIPLLQTPSIPHPVVPFSSFSLHLHHHYHHHHRGHRSCHPSLAVLVSSTDPAWLESPLMPLWITHSWCCRWNQSVITADVCYLNQGRSFRLHPTCFDFQEMKWSLTPCRTVKCVGVHLCLSRHVTG